MFVSAGRRFSWRLLMTVFLTKSSRIQRFPFQHKPPAQMLNCACSQRQHQAWIQISCLAQKTVA